MTMIYHKDWNSNTLGRTYRHTSQVFKSECRWKQSHPSNTLTQPFESLFLKTTELELTWVTNAPIDGKCFTGCFHCTLGNPHRLWHLHNPWKLVRGTWTRKNVKRGNSLLYHLLFNIKLWEFWVTFIESNYKVVLIPHKYLWFHFLLSKEVYNLLIDN